MFSVQCAAVTADKKLFIFKLFFLIDYYTNPLKKSKNKKLLENKNLINVTLLSTNAPPHIIVPSVIMTCLVKKNDKSD